jgi:hypothetical protein
MPQLENAVGEGDVLLVHEPLFRATYDIRVYYQLDTAPPPPGSDFPVTSADAKGSILPVVIPGTRAILFRELTLVLADGRHFNFMYTREWKFVPVATCGVWPVRRRPEAIDRRSRREEP